MLFHLTAVKMAKEGQQNNQQQMLARMLGKGNSHSLLIRLQTAIATLKISVENSVS